MFHARGRKVLKFSTLADDDNNDDDDKEEGGEESNRFS
jgi:hypothetical protein